MTMGWAGRWGSPLLAGLAILLLVWAAVVAHLTIDQAMRLDRVAADLRLYLDATRHWLDGGSFYSAHQLSGPYEVADGDILYPPSTLPLFVAFLLLPPGLFLVLPVTVIAGVVARWHPAPWTWPVMAACLAFTPTMVKLVHFNPFTWAAAAIALGTVYAGPSVFALLKPSLVPFILVGVRHRSWWLAATVWLGLALLFLPMWPDYARAIANSRNPAGLLYSLSDLPFVMIPIVAWLGRRAGT